MKGELEQSAFISYEYRLACLMGHYRASMKKDISALSVDITKIKTER